MASATWIEIWSYVFLLACAFFFGTVAVVALRGFGDVAEHDPGDDRPGAREP